MKSSVSRFGSLFGPRAIALSAIGMAIVFGGCSSGNRRADTHEWRYSAPPQGCCDDDGGSGRAPIRYESGQAITQYDGTQYDEPAASTQQSAPPPPPPKERIVTVYRDPQFNTAADFDFDALPPTVLRRTTEVSVHRVDEVCGPDGTCTIANHRDTQTHTATYTIEDQGMHVSVDGGVKITEGGECPPTSGGGSTSGDGVKPSSQQSDASTTPANQGDAKPSAPPTEPTK